MATDYPMSGAVAGSGYGVDVEITGPATRQSRLSVVFRFILLIPQILWACVIGLGVGILVFLNYFVVLFTGRTGFFGFLSGAVRYFTRIQGYSLYMTDAYPSFGLDDDPAYAVRVQIAHPQRVHRWRVFSYFLAIPHLIVLYVLLFAAFIAAFCAWFVLLFTAHYPVGLFNFVAMAIRYQARVNAYLYLITEGYPPFSFD
jgi:hypothetical protein